MLRCSVCHETYDEVLRLWRCPCGGALSLEIDETFFPGPEELKRRSLSIWRYKEALPLQIGTEPVSLGEGRTPLVPALWKNHKIFFKLDFLLPTGSYKDRGIAYQMTKLKEHGLQTIIEDSSGNAGASMAAYAARAGIHCQVFVPAYTSAGKCVQIESYGAELVKVPGSREETTLVTEQAAQEFYYASHNWSPYFIHGVKTYAFELWEQLGYAVPDYVIVPAGQGSLVLGCYLAFRHLLAAGKISRLPKIVAVQARGCAPLCEGFVRGDMDPFPIEKRETIAEGISSAHPVRGRQVLGAVRATEGMCIAVEDGETWEAFDMLACKGFYVEPTSAVVGAALSKLIADDVISHDQAVVAFLSGSGLKATDKILHRKEVKGIES